VLRYAIAFALRRARKIVRGLKEGLAEEERYAVADHVVDQLKQYGDSWGLSEEAKPGQGSDHIDDGRAIRRARQRANGRVFSCR
jgi:hypothetical protein